MTYTPEHITDEQRAEVLKLIRLAVSDPGQFVDRKRHNDDDRESIPAWAARAVMAALDAHPLLEIRPYHPTAFAYEAADKAVWRHRKRADDAEAKLALVRVQHGRPRTDRLGSGCIHCGIVWPCPTYLLVKQEANDG